MILGPDQEKEFASFPPVLRELVEAELAVGNKIAEFAHGFPAAPCGAYIKLQQAVTTCPRESTAELSFYDRKGSNYSGEFTDAKRHFFVLEPPHPPPVEPDMDAIRSALSQTASEPPKMPPSQPGGLNGVATKPPERKKTPVSRDAGSVLARFEASMDITYEKWHDGIGYDLTLLEEAKPTELKAIEAMLVRRGVRDWRDVEALAAIDSECTRDVLREAFSTGNTEIRMAVHANAPELIDEAARTASLVRALEAGDFYAGLTQALLEVERFHPPEIVEALLRGLLLREGGIACHFAAMLFYLHGRSGSAFDWAHRPFFLRFNTPDKSERDVAARELCAMIGVDFKRCLAQQGSTQN